MDIKLFNLDPRLTQIQIAEALEKILHKDGTRTHFRVRLDYDARGSGRNTGQGLASAST